MKVRKAWSFWVLMLALFGFYLPDVQAAPFCVEAQAVTAECYYYDGAQCRLRAKEVSGVCKVNLKEVTLPEGFGNYCMVTADGVVACLYSDSEACNRDAITNKGVCALNPRRRAPPNDLNFDIETFY